MRIVHDGLRGGAAALACVHRLPLGGADMRAVAVTIDNFTFESGSG